LPESKPEQSYDQASRRLLLQVARDSIEQGLRSGKSLEVDPEDYAEALQSRRACFVTLRCSGALRGCVGALEPARPLVCDVAHNAHGAAFRDSRFPPLCADELAGLELQISVLSPLEPLGVQSEAELLARLEPGVDGLVLADGERRGTFLPAVWEQLPDAPDFLRELKRKAGLPLQGWDAAYRVWRYTTESFE